ncbi:TIGR02099 family protein [Nitrosomonas eutropha]|uniref:YhdP family protein n=1 Tax=Nitrosomonas eutropha TaxID=916 RepID=UPI00088F192C|nr:YhdP family protein [Nitrosomonas eutropha]SCX10684.1 TIGR02099 family protein [Nitrosomonas eutropha]
MSRYFLRYCVVCLSWAGRCLLVSVLFLCLALLALRYWILPDIGNYRSDIAAAITRVAGQPVRIDVIQANWDGLRPHLSMQGVSVHDQQGHLVLIFPGIEGTVSWRSMLRGELNFHEIVIDRPALVTRRDTEGLLHIAGITLGGDRQESGFFDWLLRQRRLVVKQAIIYWQDDLRLGTVHYFESVNLLLQNRQGGKRHQFGLRAQSSGPLFSKVDIRGDLIGDSVQMLSAWQGRLFVQLQDFDLENWQEWMTLPADLTLKRGQGSVRAWMDVGAGNLSRWVADINLRKAAIHFAQHLSLLEIDHLYGRSGWSKTEDAQDTDEQWFVRDLSVELKDLPLAEPVAALWYVRNHRDGGPPEYRLQVEKFDLNVLTRLAANLPPENRLYKFLSEVSPRGTVKHVNLEWQGNWSEKSSLKANAAFSDLAVQSLDKYPAFSGASGIVNMTETDGSLFLSSSNMELRKTQQPEEKLRLDTLIGRVDWKIAHGHETAQLKFNNIVFTSDAGNGALQGSYAFNGNLPGQIDLAGYLSQADIPLLGQYIAWVTDETVVNEINKAIISGQLHDTRFHVKGTLNSQSADKKNRLSIRAETDIGNATIKTPGDWPEISGMAGYVSLQDSVLDISLSSANISGIKLQKFTLQSGDLHAEQPKIRIKGLAEGESGEIAALLRKADINQHIGELLNQAEFSGKGRLQADVSLSVTQKEFSIARMQGRYQFMDNQINFDRYIPDFYQVNGSLVFTEASMTLEGVRAKVLGGPVEISSVSAPEGGMHITASGRADFDRFQSDRITTEPVNLSHLWTQFMRGSTDWRFGMDIEHNKASIVIESSLKGVGLTLPAPLSKTAAEVVPLRLEKYFTWPHDDHTRLRYGNIITAEFQRVHEAVHHYHPVRGIIRFGGRGVLPQNQITRIEGAVARLEWDQWRELFRRHAEVDVSIDHTARGLDNILTGPVQFDVRIGQLEFLSSYFNNAHLVIDKRDDVWQMQVSSREVAGKIDWHATSPQKVAARLSRLIMPKDAPEPALLQHSLDIPGNWPNVDIEADELIVDGVLLGQMKLSAVQKQNGWQVENLDIRHPDSTLQASGLWENHRPPYRVSSHIQLQSGNIGKFLKRHGYPGRIARGEGAMTGDLEWAGKPFSINFPTLSGKLQFDAQHGQFTELKPGIGRLLGVFDLKSLPRRLTLDFYDVFGKGFGFDKLGGHVAIQNGIASTDGLYIMGSSAELVLSGEWDLVNETQALNLKVFPSFGLVTPIAGIAAMIASGTLQDPFSRVLLNEYAITGSWNDPVVIRLDEEENQVRQRNHKP